MGIVHASVIIEEIYTPSTGNGCLHIHIPAPPPTTTSATVTVQSPLVFHVRAPPPPQASPPQAPPPQASPHASPALVSLAIASKPKKKFLGLRYKDTGHIVPFVDAKGNYVSADTKELIWVPSLGRWVGGPNYVPR
ncbi:uncharacterized protein LAJ45_09124 [Morchella importuna]|uniref:Uncharacterized protein n=1 Tax=Morchella conica CCBAS932 TaxID=1392247 RepID=A0A3N4KPN4_9PEZI|nr:uncharacterized protein LAJ45_09124 [Morchella importuna]KAH8146750.1 hypothetical protein LAJ45_09124 [Morchella importuna]RPB12563.1 hypothetical protein P167DRAFT_545462 [Morchella conica CCBAS932]